MAQFHSQDRVVLVTGAGNGLGRAHAHAFTADGAAVVVNDLGGARDGAGGSAGPAQQAVDEILAAGGMELARYGVTVNAVVPTALTRLTDDLPAVHDLAKTIDLAPEGVSPLVVWLAGPTARDVTGRVFATIGGTVAVVESWAYGPQAHSDVRWTQQQLDEVLPGLLAKAAPNADMTGQRPPQ